MSEPLLKTEAIAQNGSSALPLAPRISTPVAPPPAGDEFDIRGILGMLQRRWLVVATVTVLAFVNSLNSALQQEPVYQGRFRLLVEPVNDTNPGLTGLTEGGNQRSKLDYETQIQVLQSPDLLNRSVEELNDFFPNLNYRDIISGLEIDRLGETKIIEVSYRHSNPSQVRAVLEQLAEDYLDYSLNERQTNLRQGIQFIETQLQSVKGRVDELQKELQEFRQSNRFIDPDSQAGVILGQRQQLAQQLLQLDQTLTQERARLSALSQENGAIATLNNSATYQQLVAQLRQIDAQIAQERTRFQDNSLTIRVLRERQANLMPLLRAEAQRSVGTRLAESAAQIQTLEIQRQAILQTKATLDQQFQALPVLSRQYTDLQRELQIATGSLDRFLATREGLQIEASQKEIPWQIVEAPTPNPFLVSADVQRGIIQGAMMSLAMGIGAAFLLEKLDTTFRSADDLGKKLKLQLLGSIPYQSEIRTSNNPKAFRKRKFNKKWVRFKLPHPIWHNPDIEPDWMTTLQPEGDEFYESSEFSEALKVLRINIQLLKPEKPVRSLVLSSALPGEGKSTVALWLAKTAVDMGQRVLLVDADLRRSQLHTRLKLNSTVGLCDILSLDLPVEEVIQQPIHNFPLHVLLSGETMSDPIRLISSQKMRSLMEKISHSFDLIIYDTPPLSGLGDAMLLTAHTDGLALVVRMGKSDRTSITESLESLRNAQLPILGVIANGA